MAIRVKPKLTDDEFQPGTPHLLLQNAKGDRQILRGYESLNEK